MLERAKEIIGDIAKETDSIILFHSLSGKDSITMLDLCYGKFKRIVCVYMYVVPNLTHIQRYYVYAKKKYPKIEFIQVPHYGYYSMIKTGFMGIKKNDKQRLWTLADITEKLREKLGIQWACYGFKQSDSLNRRLMLRSYDGEGKLSISWKSKKFYPLSTYKNKDILEYINREHLISPETYGGIGQSCGCDITSLDYQLYLRANFPEDLDKIYKIFPQARIILMQKQKEDEERKCNKDH